MLSLHYILVLLVFRCAIAQYIVEVWESYAPFFKDKSPFARCEATGANFGMNITSTSRDPTAAGCAVKVTPEHACSPVNFKPINESSCYFYYAVVPIGKCSYSEKAYYVQNTSLARGIDGLIVYNIEGKDPVEMDGGKYAEAVKIPVVMVDYNCMKMMIEKYPAYKGYTVQIFRSLSVLEFIVALLEIIGAGALILGCVCCRDSLVCCMCCIGDCVRAKWARCMRKRMYKKLPTKIFAIGDQPDTCVICLEEFVVGEKLTILPCKHMYHYKCIVTWFAQHEQCPTCRVEVGVEALSAANEDNDNTQSVGDQEPSSSSAQIHVIPGRDDPTSSQVPSENEASTSREGEVNGNSSHEMGQTTQNAEVSEIRVNDSHYSENEHDESRLVEVEETTPSHSSQGKFPGWICSLTQHIFVGAVSSALRTLRSFVGRMTTSTRRLQTEGVENAAFDQERNATSIDHEII